MSHLHPMTTAMSRTSLRFAPLAASVALAVFLTGCGIATPKPLTHDEIATRVQNDTAAMYKGQEPLNGALTLSDVMARSLKYNLDYRLKLMETALSKGLLDVSKLDMLPKLTADAGYRWRDNDSGGTSIGIQDRIVSLRPSTSEERAHLLGDATLSWDVLDFGLSYFRAKQAAEDVNVTDERRRKVLQNIVQDTRDAYWRALGAQRLLGEANSVADNIQAALQKTREAERAGILPPVEGLEYQRALLDAMSLVTQKRTEMQLAKRELAALMNLAPGTDFTLADTSEAALAPLPSNQDQLNQLEQMALEQRPELREEDYKTRIDALEAKKQITALFPNLNLFGGIGYDSNKYLYNENWTQGGLSMSMNLVRLAGIPAIKRTNKARMEVDDARRMALSMAVVTQVRVSVERYKLAVYDHDLAQESASVDQRLASISRAGSDNQLTSDLETLRTQARSLVSRFQEASSYAAAQSAYGRVLNSVGIDLMPEKVEGSDVASLSRAIQASLVDGEKHVFTSVADVPQVDRPFVLSVTGLPAKVDATAVRSAVGNVFTGNRLVLGNGDDSLAVELRYSAAPGKAAMRAVWDVTVQDKTGKALMKQSYQSFLPDDVSTRSVSALAEAAVLSVLDKLREFSAAPATAAANTP
jgi:outer membrane protein TolC